MNDMTTKIIQFSIVICLITIAAFVFPQQFITSNQFADNPENCPYYITIQSLLANNKLLSFDRSNASFIKRRIATFEKEASQYKGDYTKKYFNILQKNGFMSIDNVPLTIVAALAAKLAPIIDQFYLDPANFCHTPLYDWKVKRTRRILQYNLAPLYEHIPNRFMRALGATPDAFQLGLFSGFFVNNQTTTLVTQFMTGLPLLTALYVQPKYEFANVGSYHSAVPWNFFNVIHFTDPLLRKVMDVSGIDVFSSYKKDLQNKKLVGVKALPHKLPDVFTTATQIKSFINQQSYGMAYLANNIKYADLQAVKDNEAIIKHYFARPDHHSPPRFRKATDSFYQQLLTLKKKHDIILESNNPMPHPVNTKMPAGQVTINGIVAERALFTADCKRENCLFVANIAHSPGWNAIVNGQKQTIERANFAFMATQVPNGISTVWLIYEPWHRLLSYLLSMASLLIVFIVLINSIKVKAHEST